MVKTAVATPDPPPYGDNYRPPRPYQEGNLEAVTHGAESDKLVSAKATEVHRWLMTQFPWIQNADAVQVDVFCKEKARYDMLDQYFWDVVEGRKKVPTARGRAQSGIEAVPKHVIESLSRHARAVMDAIAKLAMNPVDRAALMKDAGMAKYYGKDAVGTLQGIGRELAEQRAAGTLPAAGGTR
jgi:hypothetical protein